MIVETPELTHAEAKALFTHLGLTELQDIKGPDKGNAATALHKLFTSLGSALSTSEGKKYETSK